MRLTASCDQVGNKWISKEPQPFKKDACMLLVCNRPLSPTLTNLNPMITLSPTPYTLDTVTLH